MLGLVGIVGIPDLYLIDVHVDLRSLDLHLGQTWIPVQLIQIRDHP